MKKLLLAFVFVVSLLPAFGQKSADLGILGGAAAYWGDMENVDYTKSVTPIIGVLGRYNFNKRISVRGQLTAGSLQAEGTFGGVGLAEPNTRITLNDATNLPYDLFLKSGSNAYNFQRSIQTFETVLEFNFLDYKMGSTKKERFTPYVMVGVGLFYSRSAGAGTLLLLPQARYTLLPYKNMYSPVLDENLNLTNGNDALAPVIPVGFGIKYNLTKKMGLSAEVGIRKTFTDNIDNLKDPGRFQNLDPVIGAPANEFVPSVLINNDWYATVHVSLHWQVWTDKGICKVLDKKISKSVF